MMYFQSLLAHCSVDVTSIFIIVKMNRQSRKPHNSTKESFLILFCLVPFKTGSGCKMHHLESVQTKVLYMVTYCQPVLPLKHTCQNVVLFYFHPISCQTILEPWIGAPYRQPDWRKWKFNDLVKNMTLFYFYLFHLFHSIYPHFELLVRLLCALWILHTKGILSLPPYFVF